MTDPSTSISLAPLLAGVGNFALAVLTIAAPFLFRAAFARVDRWLGINEDAATLAREQAEAQALTTYLDDLAHSAIAKADGNLASAAIDVGSPVVKALVEQALGEAPALLAGAGLSPDALAKKLVSAIGAKQVAMTATPVAATSLDP